MDGGTFACGFGHNGRLGLGTSVSVLRPTRLDEPAGLRSNFVACGEAHSGLIDTSGEVYTWGIGSFGRLGTGETKDALVPQRVNALEGNRCTMMAMGTFHTLVCTHRGKLFAWGSGIGMGLLAEDDTSVVLQPRTVTTCRNFKESMVVQVAAAPFHSVVLMDKTLINADAHAAVITWGLYAGGRLGHDKRRNQPVPLEVKLRKQQSAADAAGAAGSSLFRGWGDVSTFSPDAEGIHVREETAADAGKKNPWEIKEIACGTMHSAILTERGDVYIWGTGEFGQTGMRPEGTALRPKDLWTPTKLPFKFSVSKIACGYEHCLAVTNEFSLYSWGKGDQGQLGLGSASDVFEPSKVTINGAVVFVAAGETHSAAVMADGKFNTWGSAEVGKLGFGKEGTAGQQLTPKAVDHAYAVDEKKTMFFGDNLLATYVACGPSHTAVIAKAVIGKTDDVPPKPKYRPQLYTCGGGWFGRLGLNTVSNVYAPELVVFEKDIGTSRLVMEEVYCGGYHTCVMEQETR